MVFVSSATGCFFAKAVKHRTEGFLQASRSVGSNIKLCRVEGLENYFCLRERLSRGELP